MLRWIVFSMFFWWSGSAFAQKDLQVYIFVAEECPISIYMAKPLREATAAFADKATFYAVFPSILSTTETAEEFLTTYDLEAFNIRLDTEQELTQQLGATITPEAIITDATGTVLYRGRISDAFAAPGKMKHGPRTNVLLEALQQAAAGQAVNEPWVDAVGCYITIRKTASNG